MSRSTDAVVVDGDGGGGSIDGHDRSNRSVIASSAPCRSDAPPGGSGSRTAPCSRARQQDRGVAGRGHLAALVHGLDLEVDRRAVAVGEVLPGDGAAQPLRVADVVELPELAVELPEPGVVAHPVGAEVDEPRLAHAAVVERGRVAGSLRRSPGPSAPAASRRGRLSRRGGRSAGCGRGSGRRGAAASRRRGPCPCPTCQHTMSVTVSGPFTIGPTSSPSVDVLPPPGLGAARALAGVLGVDLGDLLVGVGRELDRRRSSSARAPSTARCGSSAGTGPTGSCPSSSRNTWAVHSWMARPAKSLSLSSTPTSALRRCDPMTRAAAAPTTRARWRSRRRARRAAGRPSSGRGAPARPRSTSSSPIRVSPPTRTGGAIGPSHRVACAVRRDRTTAGCRRRRPRRRSGTCRCRARGSAAASDAARDRRCAPRSRATPSSVIVTSCRSASSPARHRPFSDAPLGGRVVSQYTICAWFAKIGGPR